MTEPNPFYPSDKKTSVKGIKGQSSTVRYNDRFWVESYFMKANYE